MHQIRQLGKAKAEVQVSATLVQNVVDVFHYSHAMEKPLFNGFLLQTDLVCLRSRHNLLQLFTQDLQPVTDHVHVKHQMQMSQSRDSQRHDAYVPDSAPQDIVLDRSDHNELNHEDTQQVHGKLPSELLVKQALVMNPHDFQLSKQLSIQVLDLLPEVEQVLPGGQSLQNNGQMRYENGHAFYQIIELPYVVVLSKELALRCEHDYHQGSQPSQVHERPNHKQQVPEVSRFLGVHTAGFQRYRTHATKVKYTLNKLEQPHVVHCALVLVIDKGVLILLLVLG